MDNIRHIILVCFSVFFFILMLTYLNSDTTYKSSANNHGVIKKAPNETFNKVEVLKIDVCNFGMYIHELCLDCEVPIIPLKYLQHCEGLIYNMVPKCGSSSMRARLRTASRINGFAFHCIGNHRFNLPRAKVDKYVSMMSEQDRFMLVSHHYLFKFSKYMRPNDTVLFMNLIREPVDWFISAYSYFHTQSAHYTGKWWSRGPMGQCMDDSKCFNHVVQTFGAVRFLCGNDDICNNSQSDGAVQLAKRNVDQVYMLVGITEELNAFTVLLEHFLPHMFRNISQAQTFIHKKITKQKENPTDAAKVLLAKLLPYEIELYQYVKQRFLKIKRAILPNDSVMRNITK